MPRKFTQIILDIEGGCVEEVSDATIKVHLPADDVNGHFTKIIGDGVYKLRIDQEEVIIGKGGAAGSVPRRMSTCKNR